MLASKPTLIPFKIFANSSVSRHPLQGRRCCRYCCSACGWLPWGLLHADLRPPGKSHQCWSAEHPPHPLTGLPPRRTPHQRVLQSGENCHGVYANLLRQLVSHHLGNAETGWYLIILINHQQCIVSSRVSLSFDKISLHTSSGFCMRRVYSCVGFSWNEKLFDALKVYKSFTQDIFLMVISRWFKSLIKIQKMIVN